MLCKKIKFKLKGNRNYVQGGDIVNEIILNFNKKNIYKIKITFHKLITNANCIMYISESESDLKNIYENNIDCSLEVDSKKTLIKIIPDLHETNPIEYSQYDEKKVTKYCLVKDNKIELLRLSPYTFSETIIAMNKLLHKKMFFDFNGKWLVTRIDLNEDIKDREHLSLKLVHNFNYKLTKSKILVGNSEVGDIYFSLAS